MVFDVEVNGRIRHVVVERHDEILKVTIDGTSRLLSVARAGPATLSMIVLGERVASHEVGFVSDPRAEASVYVDGSPVQAALAMRRRHRGGAAETAGTGIQRVTAPMPGKVVRVLVAPGDRVEPRQPVVVVEAMKMENELRASRAGVVREVAVAHGASVEAGAVLVVIE